MNTKESLSNHVIENSFRFYLINCKSGLMHLLIFPDERVMLFDCNVVSDMEKEVLDFLDRHIPLRYNSSLNTYEKYIDIFVNSHRDEDHYKGLKKINNRFKIHSIWDSGQSGANCTSDDYQYYMGLRRRLKEEDENNLVVPVPSDKKLASIGGVDIYCLAAEEDFQENYENQIAFESASKIQHTNAMVLLFIYAGRKVLLTSDSDWRSWKEKIVPHYKEQEISFVDTDILIASHHGSRSFFTDKECIDVELYPESTYIESIKLINPIVTLISCADYEYKGYHLPNEEAMKLYKKYTRGGQVYTTYEKGTICGFINSTGYFGVIPNRFRDTMPANNKQFEIKCYKVSNEGKVEVRNGDRINIGCTLNFSIISYGNILNSYDQIEIYWEVTNVGDELDCEHKEIYYKGKNEVDGKYKFSRQLVYKGKHLIRCRVKNTKKGFDGTRIFLIEGF